MGCFWKANQRGPFVRGPKVLGPGATPISCNSELETPRASWTLDTCHLFKRHLPQQSAERNRVGMVRARRKQQIPPLKAWWEEVPAYGG